MSEILAFQAVIFICGTIAFVASLSFIRRLLELKRERRVPAADERLHDRLERIEMAVDATAVEVERISEANRFMAKLLADRSGPPAPVIRSERVITPH